MVTKVDSNKNRLDRLAIRESRQRSAAQPKRPRLNVFRSLHHIYAQSSMTTSRVLLCAALQLDKDFEEYGGNKAAARKVGEMLAKRAADKGITDVVFDRGGYIYHGRVKELAEGAREGGLKF